MLLGPVLEELAMRPRMREADLVKMLYQAAMGGDHLLGDREGFRRGLRREWNALPPERPGLQPPLQLISPRGGVWRAHLLPLRSQGADPGELFGLLAGQPLKNGDISEYLQMLEQAVDLAGRGVIPFDPDTLRRYRKTGGPAHHSRAYGPCAYRVVSDPATATSILRTISG
jgi:hypothetical protein